MQVGDHVQAINGVATDRLNQHEVLSLLKSAGTIINLEVSYEVPAGYGNAAKYFNNFKYIPFVTIIVIIIVIITLCTNYYYTFTQ